MRRLFQLIKAGYSFRRHGYVKNPIRWALKSWWRGDDFIGIR